MEDKMNVFEHAMKMEEDGRAYYVEHAQKTAVPALKKILLELAEDELKHYNLFKALRDSEKAEYKEAAATTIFATTKNVFETLKAEGNQSLTPDPVKVWEHARQVEKDSEAFYREKADETDDANQKTVWTRIADEEHRHYVALDNVIQFLSKPAQWLEDAEWNKISD
jgi:rubrerythrin